MPEAKIGAPTDRTDKASVGIGFWALIATQFQGAFSDNALKWLVSFLVLESASSKEYRDFLFVLVVPLVFAVPFLVFLDPRWLFCRPLQQTKRHDLDEDPRSGRDVRCYVCTVGAQAGFCRNRAVLRVHARGNLRTV